jgi:hypothetical protein
MKPLKHIGRLKNNGAKVLVAFRVLPGETDHALVIPVASLSAENHDSIMKVVESDQAQDSYELGEILFTRTFPDGRPILQALRIDNILVKAKTDSVVMTPTTTNEVQLDQLNVLIAEQKNCAVDDLPFFVSGSKGSNFEVEEIASGKDLGEPANVPVPETAINPSNDGVLSDKDIAKGLRSQADSLYKEAARLRKQAEDLDPTVKKTARVKDSVDA